MTRRYDEPITVSLGCGPVGPDPQAFTWRGRRYAVSAIHERWAQRRSWWRDCEQAPDQVALEQRVWRVEARRAQARPGAGASVVGVFELGLDGTPEGTRWSLLRAED